MLSGLNQEALPFCFYCFPCMIRLLLRYCFLVDRRGTTEPGTRLVVPQVACTDVDTLPFPPLDTPSLDICGTPQTLLQSLPFRLTGHLDLCSTVAPCSLVVAARFPSVRCGTFGRSLRTAITWLPLRVEFSFWIWFV